MGIIGAASEVMPFFQRFVQQGVRPKAMHAAPIRPERRAPNLASLCSRSCWKASPAMKRATVRGRGRGRGRVRVRVRVRVSVRIGVGVGSGSGMGVRLSEGEN